MTNPVRSYDYYCDHCGESHDETTMAAFLCRLGVCQDGDRYGIAAERILEAREEGIDPRDTLEPRSMFDLADEGVGL